jgi:hypothetical protein
MPKDSSGAASSQYLTNAGQTAYVSQSTTSLIFFTLFLSCLFVALFIPWEVNTHQAPTLFSVGIGLDKRLNKPK